ncbi:hypothetical protein [Sphingomonas sp. YL-JM2C]
MHKLTIEEHYTKDEIAYPLGAVGAITSRGQTLSMASRHGACPRMISRHWFAALSPSF